MNGELEPTNSKIEDFHRRLQEFKPSDFDSLRFRLARWIPVVGRFIRPRPLPIEPEIAKVGLEISETFGLMSSSSVEVAVFSGHFATQFRTNYYPQFPDRTYKGEGNFWSGHLISAESQIRAKMKESLEDRAGTEKVAEILGVPLDDLVERMNAFVRQDQVSEEKARILKDAANALAAQFAQPRINPDYIRKLAEDYRASLQGLNPATHKCYITK